MNGLLDAASSVLAAKIPFPAGLILSAAIIAVGCVVVQAVAGIARGQAAEWEMTFGGLILAALLGAIGLLLVAAGAPAFK